MGHKKRELIALDFTEHDTREALEYLIQLVDENKLAGIIFAGLSRHTPNHVFGATGRLATNPVEAVGLAAILKDQLSQPFLLCSSCCDHR